jgi:metal-dependent amidase/aminoacylase/carboxypeptidase family protein
MLVGAARYLAETRNFDGTAVLIFQPGEEGYAGAKAMIRDGCSSASRSTRSMPCTTGPACARHRGREPRPMMAAADRITIEITGKGGHGAHAYLTVDPVLVAGTSSRRCKASSRAMCARSKARSSACAACRPVTWGP